MHRSLKHANVSHMASLLSMLQMPSYLQGFLLGFNSLNIQLLKELLPKTFEEALNQLALNEQFLPGFC